MNCARQANVGQSPHLPPVNLPSDEMQATMLQQCATPTGGWKIALQRFADYFGPKTTTYLISGHITAMQQLSLTRGGGETKLRPSHVR
jgi:hypothetical protein